MKQISLWLQPLSRLLLLVAAAAMFGALYGYPLQAVIAALLGLFFFRQSQMHRVQAWLDHPENSPPDVYGIWGELTARIYLHQRNNKKIQKELQSNVEHLQGSFASIRDGVVMLDEYSTITWCNAAVLPLLGLRHPEDCGQTLTNLVREPAFTAYFLAQDYSAPLRYLASGNNALHLQVEITHFGDNERLLFVRDVSEAVRMEQMRRDFVANVSHELRTPLTVITGYLDMFRDNPDSVSGQFAKPLEQMSQQAQRMESMLKDLLWLSRIESDAGAGKHEPVDIPGLLQELLEESRRLYPHGRLHLALDSSASIEGDYQELYSAGSNLVANAMRYGGEEVQVAVRWSRQGRNLVLSVQDDGPGVEESHLPRLTERFYRVDDSRNSATGGTGLGLAIVKHVAQSHGAQLVIESEMGKGSTFSLVFAQGE